MTERRSSRRPPPAAPATHWPLDPDVVFLNHGSFGACPTKVLEAQQLLRKRLESGPVQFLLRDAQILLDSARESLAGFVDADAEDLVFVPNATTGVNTVLRSLDLEPGDELLTTNHEYNACRNALRFVAERSGARVVVAPVPFPITSPSVAIEAVLDRVTSRTRLALIDHVTSLTGMVMPIEELIGSLSEKGVDTLVDGAHAPGMLPLSIRDLAPAYYTGNCHKWLCAPKGAALLYVRRDLQAGIRPLTISHGANAPVEDRSRFRMEFDWTGTHDPTPYLCVPEAMRFMGSLYPGGWPELMRRNRALALEARELLCGRLGVPPACPGGMIGTLASIPLAAGEYDFTTTALAFDPMDEILREEYGIEVPVMACPDGPGGILRIAAQAYNSIEQYQYLADAVLEIRARRDV
ncbi:MAG: aminotransferase class V-fold PLP-dependent enzyme [Candidatus Eisenbacteria bacterium]|nr:aminotransferase class V-fold PLP-dependent enzyme [Candidatus Eisenbacteria bacterium]